MKTVATQDREIVTTRVFDFPRSEVFKAWTDPRLLAQWWGPKGFTNTFQEFNLQPGGKWRFTMHSPEGVDYVNECIFDEITESKQLVFQHLKPVHYFVGKAIFEDVSGGTNVTYSMVFESAEECAKVKEFIANANEENFDRLEEVLSSLKF